MKDIKTKDLRTKVAKEAALLLYTSQEKEFKQAKDLFNELKAIDSNYKRVNDYIKKCGEYIKAQEKKKRKEAH